MDGHTDIERHRKVRQAKKKKKAYSWFYEDQRQWSTHLPSATPGDQQLLQGTLQGTITFWGPCTDLGKRLPLGIQTFCLGSYLPLAILLNAPDDSTENLYREGRRGEEGLGHSSSGLGPNPDPERQLLASPPIYR